MTVEILASASPGEVRVAAVQDDTLLDYAIWRPGMPDGVGDVRLGRITTRVPAMAGAFVALDGMTGFLPDSAGAAGRVVGDTLPVCVVRAAQGGKGPRLTANIEPNQTVPSPGPGPLLELARRHPDAVVTVDDAALAARLRPALAERLRLSAAAFDARIEEEVQALAEPSVDLPGGLRIHITPTPALIAIDVDAGGAVNQRHGKAAAHLAANRATLPALARHIRLRNLSGAILVDFAGLSANRRRGLGPPLEAALADDPLRPRLLGFTVLGLAEIVRPRMHPALHEMLAGAHAAGLMALRCIAARLAAEPHYVPALRAAPAVVAALEADTEALPDLARRAGRSLILRADPRLSAEGWTIEMSDA